MIFVGPFLVFLLLAAPGVRLLRLAANTRERPEFWGGLYFIGAAIGLSMRVLGSSLFLENPNLAERLNIIGHLTFASGTISMAIFTYHVFHPNSPIARAFAGLSIAAILISTAHTLLGGNASIENSYSMLAANAARLVPTSWAFFESLSYYRSMRRRQTLGLADPIVTNRFLLWSAWTGAVTLLPLSALILRGLSIITFGNEELASGINADLLPSMMRGVRILFLIIAPIATIALSLSFFPPAAYLNRLRSGSGSAGDGSTA